MGLPRSALSSASFSSHTLPRERSASGECGTSDTTARIFLALLTFGGIFFAWWARIHLGRLWSGSITRKEGHHVVDTGPYRLVRHPIYTGLIGATIATATAAATVTAVVGAVLITFGMWLKARTEERFLTEELGPEAYAAYQRRVPMLVPFV